ncbi:DUF3784 domain-containing protein [Parabacteroides sp. OttesenSCG-928-G06]|nr:DUF3784 domain-containing protein [Parabacteroides sp. OttesenSCG-928-G06]
MEKIVLVITGVFFIGLGLLVYKYPWMIAGYNTMPKEKREKIDIKPIARIMRACFIVMGGVMILFPFIFDWIGLSSWNEFLPLVVIFGGVTVMMILTNLDSSVRGLLWTKGKKLTLLFTVIFIVFIFGSLYQTGQPARITVADNKLRIEGAYGVTIPLEEITHVEVTDTPPRMNFRRNGLSFSNTHKGHFHSKEYGAHLLFLHGGKAPYLLLTTEKNGKILINRSTPEEIDQLFAEINKL